MSDKSVNINKCDKCRDDRVNAQVWRSFEPKRNEWAYWRRCHFCGALFAATRFEYRNQEGLGP